MSIITIKSDGFFLLLNFEPGNVDDQEILAEAFLLLHRRARRNKGAK